MHFFIVPFMSTLKIGDMIFVPSVWAVPEKVQRTFVPSPSGVHGASPRADWMGQQDHSAMHGAGGDD